MTKINILVVDDDPKIRSLLRRCLEAESYAIFEAEDEASAVNLLAKEDIALITLDISLGADNGLDVARNIRKTSEVPIIMVTGKNDVIDRVVGLEIGADDYITKPFHVREVVARVHSVLRRSAQLGTNPETMDQTDLIQNDSGLHFDGLTARPDRYELFDRDGQLADLTSGDFRMLAIFLARPHRVLSREVIMDLMHGTEWAPLDRTVDNQVARLRKKIERDPGNPQLIKTVRGVGYIFAADVNQIA